MARLDLHTKVFAENALDIAAITTNTSTVGEVIDLAQIPSYQSLEFVIQSGTITDGVYVAKIEDGSDLAMTDAADVVDYLLIPSDGTAIAGTTFTGAGDSNKVKRIGYVGHKQFVRLTLVSTGVTTGGTFGAIAIKSDATFQPTPEN